MRESVLNDVGDIIDGALRLKRSDGKGIGTAPHYRHRKTCQTIKPVTDFDGRSLIKKIYESIASNLKADGSRSKQNWRWETNPAKADDSKAANRAKKLEVRLERTIIETSDDWANQVPTASGLMVKRSGNSGSIDLVHRCGDGLYEFIELKVKSNNPLYAAMEILQYGILYALARQRMKAGEEKKELLKAKAIHLKVLAPSSYYKGFNLEWLEKEINRGLKAFLTAHELSFEMNFNFEQFPPNFKVEVESFPNGDSIKRALAHLRPVYP
jgi:hypothetical protein